MTTKTEITRAFSKAHQQAGAPYRCLNGFAAKICEWVGNTAIGYFTSAKGEAFAAQWNSEGREAQHFAHAGAHDLVMTPLGYIDGRPVFMGDELIRSDGERRTAQASWNWNANYCFDAYCWPVSAPVIQTKMSGYELQGIYQKSVQGSARTRMTEMTYEGMTAVANAAIDRAILDGQVLTKEAHEAALVRLGDELRGCAIVQSVEARAARDMAVAQAALAAGAKLAGAELATGAGLDPIARLDYFKAYIALDPETIIASVK